jgi:opacity protein-like surface antigen
MNRMLVTIGCAALALACAAAQSEERYGRSAYGSGLYFGASAGQLIYKEDGLDTMRPTIIEARLGQDINRYFAVEGRIGGGINRDNVNGTSTSVQMLYAAYAKGILPLTPVFSAYGLAGLAGTQLRHNYPDFNTTDTGFSYGVGAELKVGNEAALTLEWVRVNDGSNLGYYYTADQVALGVNWHF